MNPICKAQVIEPVIEKLKSLDMSKILFTSIEHKLVESIASVIKLDDYHIKDLYMAIARPFFIKD